MSVMTVTLRMYLKKLTHFWWEYLWTFGEYIDHSISKSRQLKGKFTLRIFRNHLKLAEQVSLGVLQHPTKFQVKILRRKNL